MLQITAWQSQGEADMGIVLMQASGLFVQYFPSCFCLVSRWPLEHKKLISALQEE